jgi:hypothetical protein
VLLRYVDWRNQHAKTPSFDEPGGEDAFTEGALGESLDHLSVSLSRRRGKSAAASAAAVSPFVK